MRCAAERATHVQASLDADVVQRTAAVDSEVQPRGALGRNRKRGRREQPGLRSAVVFNTSAALVSAEQGTLHARRVTTSSMNVGN